MSKNILYSVLLAVLLASCADVEEQAQGDGPSTAVRGSTPVGFSAYANRGVHSTRSGMTGVLDLTALEQSQANGGGFGVFAYHTDLKKYDQTYFPNFMYNQGVFKNGANWEYTPLMYWPNEYGYDAGSDDEDKVSFFAYAPYVATTSPASGSVENATWGITGFSRNSALGDPIVKYIASFDADKSVDLCWGVCADASWAKMQDGGSQPMTVGLPWLDVEHPQGVGQKMTFTFRHALSQLNVQIDADPDIAVHDEATGVSAGTKIYVRSISFTGIAMQGALNLNNTVANTPLWLDYSGATDLPYGTSVTVKDGRRDGREGAAGAEATNEIPAGLNPQVIQNSTATTGVTHELQNLFNGAALTTPVYVIPTGERMSVTIVYDVETVNPILPGLLSDGVTHGVSIENSITKDIIWSEGTGLESGKKYTLKLHLGLNSVKFSAAVDSWDDSVVNGEGWLPGNTATAVSLSLGASMSMTIGGSASTIIATTTPADAVVSWTNSNDAVATIAAAGSGSRAATRGTVNDTHSIVVTPVSAGTTVITATTAYGSQSCTVTVTNPSLDDATLTVAPSANSLTYNGSDQALVSAGTANGGTLKYALGTSSSTTSAYSTDIPEATEAGTYYVWYYVEGDASHNDTPPVYTTVTIAKAADSISFLTEQYNKQIGDASFTQTVTKANDGDGTVVYSISNSGSNATVNASTGQVSIGSAAGTATVTATVTDGTNYTYAVKTATYTINITSMSSPSASPTVGNWSDDGTIDVTGDPGISLASATVGMIVASDGKAYYFASNATAVGGGAVAVVGYKNGSSGYAVALVDASQDTWNNITNNGANKNVDCTLADGKRGSVPVAPTGTTWKVLNKANYELVWQAMGSANAYDTSNGLITAAGGTALDGYYWSTQENNSGSGGCRFDESSWLLYGTKTTTYNVRPVLAW